MSILDFMYPRANPARFSGKRRFGGHSSGKFGGPRSSGRGGGFARKSRFSDERIDSTRYVKKAVAPKAEEVYAPTHTFADFDIDRRIKENLLAHGYTIPTPIQDQAIKPILEGRDVVAIANTGTGKTATFLLPTLTKIHATRGERALILVPTRELAQQVADELRMFSRNMPVHSLIAIGGMSISQQISLLRRNPQFLIATPGRLKDLIQRNAISLSQFRTVILDEVDRMVDIGFLPDVRFIVDKLAKPRQSLFFSATATPEIHSIIASFATDPVTISVKKTETASSVEQDVVKIERGKEKVWKLFDLARDKAHAKMLVFVRTKRGADQLSRELYDEGFFVSSIHGNKSQGQRTRAIADFKNGRIRILVATDVAARGIDIPDVSLVVNYDEPATYSDYVHRIGRTGRAGKAGKALTFVIGR